FPFSVTGFSQALAERHHDLRERTCRRAPEKSDHGHCLLRSRRQRPSSRYCHGFDEITASHCLPRGSGKGIVAAQTCSAKGPLMSALGHKRTYAVQNGTSALPPKATSNAT